MQQENEWLEQTYTLLERYKKDRGLKQIVKDTGLKYGWLNDFSRKRSENPGIQQVKKLYDYLNNQLNLPTE